jgi:putative ABC transport system substrate-binding protein
MSTAPQRFPPPSDPEEGWGGAAGRRCDRMRRRDFTLDLLIAAAFPPAWAQEPAKQHRIAIVIPAGPVAGISETGVPFWQAFFGELRRRGDIAGQNLSTERYSGDGKPEGYADLARKIVSQNPDVIVAANDATAKAARAASGTIPIVWIGGDPVQAGLAASLARPGGTVTGVTVFAGAEIWGKRLQILKEAFPAAARTAYLTTRVSQAVEGCRPSAQPPPRYRSSARGLIPN